MPPVRTRNPPRRFTDSAGTARGRPATRRARGATRPPVQTPVSTHTPAETTPDDPVTASLQAIITQLGTLQQANAALMARVEAMEAQGGGTSSTASNLHMAGHSVVDAVTADLTEGSSRPSTSSNLHMAGHSVVDAVTADLTGGLPRPSTSSIVHVPVDLHVTDKTRQSIWQGKFVEMCDLLPKDGDEQFALTVDTNGEPSLVLTKKTQSKKLSFTRWAEAWNVFVYISGQSPQPGPRDGFAKHYEVVSGLFHKGHDFDYYDRQFRLMIEKGLTQWGDKNFDLAFEAKQRQVQNGRAGPTKNAYKKEVTVPYGYCERFHKKGYCSFRANCKFSHQCISCQGNHSAQKCQAARPFRGRGKDKNNPAHSSNQTKSSAGESNKSK